MNRMFADRGDAGRVLAECLQAYAGRPDVVVLGLPRGGVPVAFEVARSLGVPFDVFLVRKLGAPGQEELAMGAIASGGVVVINDEVVDGLRVPWEVVDSEIARERMELTRRELLYRGGRRPIEVRGRTVILVDDGLATGSTMRAAVKALRRRQPAKIVVAVPTAAPSTCRGIPEARRCLHLRGHARSRFGRSASGTRTSTRSATRRFVRLLAQAGRRPERRGAGGSAARRGEP